MSLRDGRESFTPEILEGWRITPQQAAAARRVVAGYARNPLDLAQLCQALGIGL